MDELKTYILNAENKAQAFLKEYNEPVFLYGGGVSCYFYLKWMHENKIEPEGIIESDISKWETKGYRVYDLPVYDLDYVNDNYSDCSIVIASPKYLGEIRTMLEDNCPEAHIYGFEAEIYLSFIKDIEAYRKMLIDNWDRINSLYYLLEDDLSRRTLKAFIRGRVSGDLKYFSGAMVSDQYYPRDIFDFNEQEVMVELGTNDGKTFLEFIKKVNSKYKSIYLFEPDPECIGQITSILRDNASLDNVHLIEKGAWNEETVLSFEGDGNYGNGHISEEGSINIPTTTVDTVVKECVTFIKMDIEGAELNALKGASRIIKDYKSLQFVFIIILWIL